MVAQLGYCTNVHAGVELDELEANLAHYALAVQRQFRKGAPMGLGLWLPATAARTLHDPDRLGRLARWLDEHHLVPFTLNGFPYGDFHQAIVKFDVYYPNWSDPRRLEYTLDLIHALDGLLPPGMEGSISTLPIAWGIPRPDPTELRRAARNLCRITDYLAALESDAGRLIYLCLEPEPGCVLQRSDDVIRFFEEYLLPEGNESYVRRYLRVCHDICHSAVMFENQADALHELFRAGIQVGKVQISAAVRADFDRLSDADRSMAAEELGTFVENRYLHQTSVLPSGEITSQFFADLPDALADASLRGPLTGHWRVHFHVPIFLDKLNHVRTTRDEICKALRVLADQETIVHYEVETYAWNVLPPRMRQPTLADGIAAEMKSAAEELRSGGQNI